MTTKTRSPRRRALEVELWLAEQMDDLMPGADFEEGGPPHELGSLVLPDSEFWETHLAYRNPF